MNGYRGFPRLFKQGIEVSGNEFQVIFFILAKSQQSKMSSESSWL